MHIERLLAQIRKSALGKSPHAERVLARGTTCQWNKEFLAATGTDMTCFSVKTLVKTGAPLNRSGKKQKRVSMPSKRRVLCSSRTSPPARSADDWRPWARSSTGRCEQMEQPRGDVTAAVLI